MELQSRIKELLAQGEGLTVEFKTCKQEISHSFYETVCAFLNRDGGEILLGVEDDGSIVGVDAKLSTQLISNIINCLNNDKKLFPPLYLKPEAVIYKRKTLIYLQVPSSSQPHQLSGKYFDRNQESDLDISLQIDSLEQLFLRKQQSSTEFKIYPFVQLEDLRHDLIAKVRRILANLQPDHAWLALNDMELTRSAGLYRMDRQTGQTGFTLAAVLLLGDDSLIQDVLPFYRIDALVKVHDQDRYDDRDDIRTNLLDAYERLMSFVKKHISDPFYLEGEQRVSLRDKIFREVVANLLVHREYTHASPARLIIEPAQVVLENANRPHFHGRIDPFSFTAHPKNPLILKFFRQLGWVDELGSGVRNTYKFGKIFTPNREPEFIEDTIFKTIIPIPMAKQAVLGKNHSQSGHSNEISGHSNEISGHSNEISGHSNEISGHSSFLLEGKIWESLWQEAIKNAQNTQSPQYTTNPKTNKLEEVPVRWSNPTLKKTFEQFGGASRFAKLPENHLKEKAEFKRLYLRLLEKQNKKKPITEAHLSELMRPYQKDYRKDYFLKMESIFIAIFHTEGRNTTEYAKLLDLSIKSARKYIHTLLSLKLIEVRGESKSRGYFLSSDSKEKLNDLD